MESEVKYNPVVHLSYANVAVDNATNPSTISIMIKASKLTNYVKAFIGSTGNDLCPVIALMSYLAMR